VLAHRSVKGLLAGVSKRRMTEIMNESESFDKVDVESELRGDGARDLRNLDRVRETVAKVVGVPKGENLSLIFEASKGARMDDTVAVALEVVAVRMRRLGEAAPAGLFHANGAIGEHEGRITAQ
jgi:hypothetical protein